jgi:hypothetical protein
MDFTKVFLNSIKNEDHFSEALSIIKENSSGGIWLIGGFVYRSIVNELYGIPNPKVDYDFIVENPTEIKLPLNWKHIKNKFNNPKFTNGIYEIDCVPLRNIHSIIRRKLEPSINNYLTGTPLNIQSIAYDCINKKIIGDIGIDAIERKAVAINNLKEAKHYAQIKKISLEDFIKEKAESLRFSYYFK